MKKILFCLFLFPLAISTIAQDAYKGQFYVAGTQFSLMDGDLHMKMEIDYERLHLSSGESLTLTPILRAKEKYLRLPSILINGARKQKTYHRMETLYPKRDSLEILTTSPVMVISNDAKKSRNFMYTVSVPFSEWMRSSSLFLQTEECDCNDMKGGVFEDKIEDVLYGIQYIKVDIAPDIDSGILSWVNILDPASEEETIHHLTGNIPFNYTQAKSWEKLSDEKRNYEVYFRLRDAVSLIRQEIGTQLISIQLTGYGSPTGNLHKNEQNAAIRALSLKNYLRENDVMGKTPLEVSWIAEDWDSIYSLVKASDMMLREAVLDIMRSVNIDKGREQVLISLANGAPYKYLSDRIFPQVRRVEFEIVYSRRNHNTNAMTHMVNRKSKQMNQLDLYTMAEGYLKGSQEFNDVIDLTARLFPESPTANINAAAVALSKKDLKRARHYLERFSTYPTAYNNMGVLCWLEGNADKAEVYLEMALALGVPQAKALLEELRKKGTQ